jgi:hypothetical protein
MNGERILFLDTSHILSHRGRCNNGRIATFRGVSQCIHGVALATLFFFFFNLTNFLIRLYVFTLNYFNNVDLATPNKFICQKNSRDTKDKKKVIIR